MTDAALGTMDPAFHADAYLARIGWRGTLRPSLQTLAALLRAHMFVSPAPGAVDGAADGAADGVDVAGAAAL